jgi:hypothetical protein
MDAFKNTVHDAATSLYDLFKDRKISPAQILPLISDALKLLNEVESMTDAVKKQTVLELVKKLSEKIPDGPEQQMADILVKDLVPMAVDKLIAAFNSIPFEVTKPQ